MKYADDDAGDKSAKAESTESGVGEIKVNTLPEALPETNNALESAGTSPTPNAARPGVQQRSDFKQFEDVGEQKVPSSTCANHGSLDLRINDWHGHPIGNLEFRVIQEKKIAFQGMTDANGEIPRITGLKIGRTFEVHVRKDSGVYKFAALGKIYGEENYACLESPKTRFEFSTEPHNGNPGSADQRKEKTIQSHNQKSAAEPKITGNRQSEPTTIADRDAQGNPKTSVVDGLRNWYNRNADNTAAPTSRATDVEKVKRLIDFAYRQAEWKYQDGITTDAYIKKMHDRTFVEPEKKARSHSEAMCNKYVKIALWYAYHDEQDITPIGSGVSLAKNMGPALLKAGFFDVTSQLPDARWAAPGDIIVYQKKLNPGAAGHIDIRTYEGYISDFVTMRLPAKKYKITGVYRRYFDPLPERRMRAFLKAIREWECHEENDDSKRYYLLQQPINSSRRFADTTTHPFNLVGGDKTFAGAYQITLGNWRDGHDRGDTPLDFSPLTQDRIAIWKIEDRGALGWIRNGEVERAIGALLLEWSSLPGGTSSRKGRAGDKSYRWTIAEFKDAYEKNLRELTR